MTSESGTTSLRRATRSRSERDWFDYRPRLRSPLWRGSRDAMLRELETAKRLGGDFVRVRLGPVSMYVVSDPEAIRTVLVTEQRNFVRYEPERSVLRKVVGNGVLTSMGDTHRRQRRLIQPLFQPKRLAGYADAIGLEAARLLAEWETRTGRVVDVHEEMTRLTLLVIARVLFGRDLRERVTILSRAVTAANRGSSSLAQILSGGRLSFLPTRSMRELRAAVRALDELVYGLVAERRASGDERDDLLGLLLSARDDEAAPGAKQAGMTDAEVRDELVTLFGAGHETTASLLSWTWYLLATHSEVEARLHAELAEEIGGRPPDFADLPRLVYTDRVLRESMRLFPPAWINGRVNLEATLLAGRPLPARSMVTTSPWLVHRDARFFPDPERFDPDRFSPAAAEGRPRFAYFPFGGGARQCIGQAFAEAEAKLLLAAFAQRFNPRLEPGTRVKPEPMVTLRPKGGLPMRLVARRDTARAG